MIIQDLKTGIIKEIFLDVNDQSFRFVLIQWNDIRKMVNEETNPKTSSDELLEFEF